MTTAADQNLGACDKVVVTRLQIIQAMNFHDRPAGRRDRSLIGPRVSALPDQLGLMWFKKQHQAEVAVHGAVFDLIRAAGVDLSLAPSEDVDEVEVPGKGSLQCAVVGVDGQVLREVSLKARVDLLTGRVYAESPAWLVKSTSTSSSDHPTALDFDPVTELDPQTGERYTDFCYFDDIGKSCSFDPVTRTANIDAFNDATSDDETAMISSPRP